jgi:hypothetical protein
MCTSRLYMNNNVEIRICVMYYYTPFTKGILILYHKGANAFTCLPSVLNTENTKYIRNIEMTHFEHEY